MMDSLYSHVSTRRRIILRREDDDVHETLLTTSTTTSKDNKENNKLMALHMKTRRSKEMILEELAPNASFLLKKYQARLLRLTYSHWKQSIGANGSKYNKRMLTQKFLCSIPLSYLNSSHHLGLYTRAKTYSDTQLLKQGWVFIYTVIIEARRIEALYPIADNQFKIHFMKRVWHAIFHGIVKYASTRKSKRLCKLQGDKFYKCRLISNGYDIMIFNYQQRMRCKERFQSGKRQKEAKVLTNAMDELSAHIQDNIYHRSLLGIGKLHHEWWLEQRFMDTFTYYTLASIHDKQSISTATSHHTSRCLHNAIDDFKTMISELHKKMNKMRTIYRMSLQRKAIIGLQLNAFQSIKIQTDTLAPIRYASACKIQARIRGILDRIWTRNYRVNSLTSALMIQKAIRVYIAKRRRHVMMRYRQMRMYKIEQEEEKRMWEEECLSRYYMYVEVAVLKCQRIFRGYCARDVFRMMRVEASTDKSIKFYQDIEAHLDQRRRYLAEEPMRVRLRREACIIIQRCVRGLFGRIKAKKEKRNQKISACLGTLQRHYKITLARRQLNALKRAKVNDNRILSAARYRGYVLRSLGFKKKADQTRVLRVLDRVGLHPTSFQHDIRHLIQDTLMEGVTAYNITKQYLKYYKSVIEARWSKNSIENLSLLSLHPAAQRIITPILLHDAVRITDPDHAYAGYTGQVVRADRGNNMYEVMLDRQHKVVYVHVDCSALGQAAQRLRPALHRIEVTPRIHSSYIGRVYPIALPTKDYSKHRITAAYTIQRAWRLHFANIRLTGQRYAMWKREIARQRYGLHLLAELNATSAESVDFLHKRKFTRFRLPGDYIRHPLRPPHLREELKQVLTSEVAVMRAEFEQQARKRNEFMLRADLAQMSNYFDIGRERLTFFRKMSVVFWRDQGLVMRPGTTGGYIGRKGLSELKKRAPTVSGTEQFSFPQFKGSYHIRYDKLVLYQGEWGGQPFITPLKPHGEGLVVFMSGWRFCREKVLYLTVLRCADLASRGDTYCQLHCGSTQRCTQDKSLTHCPEFYESFEIDVTDPNTVLAIDVMEREMFSEDKFLGRIEVPVSDLADGKEKTEKYRLRGEYFYDKFTEKEKRLRERHEVLSGADKRGTIELRMQWGERVTADDIVRNALQIKSAIRLQSRMRIFFAKNRLTERRLLKQRLDARIYKVVSQLASVFRIRLCKRRLRLLKKNKAFAIKIQKRVRIFQAKNELAFRKKHKAKSIQIQACARGFLVRLATKRAAAVLMMRRVTCVKVIQRNVRRRAGFLRACIQRKRIESEKDTEYYPQPVSDWIVWYGCDAGYGLRRNRRIMFRALRRILNIPQCRIVSRFGLVYTDLYASNGLAFPVQPLDMDELESTGMAFLDAFLPAFDPRSLNRQEVSMQLDNSSHRLQLHIPSSIKFQSTVFHFVIIIQCMVRRRQAKRLARLRRVMLRFLRRFKARYLAKHQKALNILLMLRKTHTKTLLRKMLRLLRREKRAALQIQCAVRCWYARCIQWEHRRIRTLTIMKSIPIGHEPYKSDYLLQESTDSYWMVDTTEYAELIINLSRKHAVAEIAILASTFASSPGMVTVSGYSKDKKYEVLVHRHPLKSLKRRSWQMVNIPPTVTKYIKLQFESNFGDPHHMAIRCIAIIQAKERSAKIVQHPDHCLIEQGPPIGVSKALTLSVRADGWPEPSYQWYCDGQLMLNETSPDLKLELLCVRSNESRIYRCVRCKMICSHVSWNMYAIECGNCDLSYTYQEISEYESLLREVLKKDEGLQWDKKGYVSLLQHLEKAIYEGHNREVERVRGQLAETEAQLIIQLRGRLYVKRGIAVANIYTGEGSYYCMVKNLRGMSIEMTSRSDIVTVVVERPAPSRLSMEPFYVMRRRMMRRQWGVYKSLLGSFVYGALDGIVTIRFEDGCVYEGPYVDESFVDATGRVDSIGRKKHHYGYYTCTDNRVYEGLNVDNHFSPEDLNSVIKLSMPGQFVYEGEWCDEKMHGVGLCTYNSGDVYEGTFHQNARFGQGQYKSIEGWAYEGAFNANQRHGYGSIRWKDGGFYIGYWHRDKRTGKGIMLTRILDLYRGEFKDDHLHGMGELFYSNGSSYSGSFRNSVRHGKGRLRDKDGSEYFGDFVNDAKHGDFVVKNVLRVDSSNNCESEIRLGQFSGGKLVEWKRIINKLTTDNFVDMFYRDRGNFDGVYSMIIAKNLPNIPIGLDPDNPDVQMILERIRADGGKLVSEVPFLQALEAVKIILQPIREMEATIALGTIELEQLKYVILLLGFRKKKLSNAVTLQQGLVNANLRELEHYWLTEKTHSRLRYLRAVEALARVEKMEFQILKVHHIPPIYVQRMMDAVSFFLQQPSTKWMQQKLLLADHRDNAREGDSDALMYPYECKLVHLFQKFDILEGFKVNLDCPAAKKVLNAFADPRYNKESYYIEHQSKAAPFIVETIKATLAYIMAARKVRLMISKHSRNEIECSRMKVALGLLTNEFDTASERADALADNMASSKAALEQLQRALEFADDFAGLMHEAYRGKEQQQRGLDYYQRLELAIEEKVDALAVESCVESLITGTEERAQKDLHKKALNARALGVSLSEIKKSPCNLKLWLETAVDAEQERLIGEGRSMGLPEDDELALTAKEEAYSIAICGRTVLQWIAEFGNESVDSDEWMMLSGKRISKRCIFVLAWQMWRSRALIHESSQSVTEWEAVFGTAEACAEMAIQARVNFRMTAKVKRQGRLWAEAHLELIAAAENTLAIQFENENPQDTAEAALNAVREDPRKLPPLQLAQALCWNKLNTFYAREAEEELQFTMGKDFQKEFGRDSAAKAVSLLNELDSDKKDEDRLWAEHALYWRNIHTDEYYSFETGVMDRMALQFEAEMAEETHIQAAICILNSHIGNAAQGKYPVLEISFKPTKELFGCAKCWSTKHQARAENAMRTVIRDFRTESEKSWTQLSDETDKFRLGSRLFVSDAFNDPSETFRVSLLKANLWLVGYLINRHAELLANLEHHKSRDPAQLIVDINMRPSTLKNMIELAVADNEKAVRAFEKELTCVNDKLSIWMQYFGSTYGHI